MSDMKQIGTEPAFPCEGPNARAFGLTKREWMIGQVAAGYIANKDRPQHFHPEDDADWIVRLADLLLAKANEGRSDE